MEQEKKYLKIIKKTIHEVSYDENITHSEEEILDSLIYLKENHIDHFEKYSNTLRDLLGCTKKIFEQSLYERTIAIKEKNKAVGFEYNKYAKFKCLNPHKFARYVLKRHTFVRHNETDIYKFNGKKYELIENIDFQKLIKKELDHFEKDIWTDSLHKKIKNAILLKLKKSDELKSPKNIILLKNGIFDINKNSFSNKFDSNIFITTQLDINYNPKAKCPIFIKTLNDMMLNDSKLLDIIQEIMGYCITTEVKAQKLFIFYGEGSNGKSVISNILMKLCGKENTSSLSLKNFLNRFDKAVLVDKLLNISTENELSGKKLETQELKAISAGESITIERKGKDVFTYKPYVKLLFSLNNLPITGDNSYGFLRRIIIIPFRKIYMKNPKCETQGKINVHLEDELTKELDGILNFAIEGFERLKKNDFQFTKSEIVDNILNEYKISSNPYLEFYKENLEITYDNKRIDKKILYNIFIDWCKDKKYNSYCNITQRMFTSRLKSAITSDNHSIMDTKSNGKNYFIGMKLIHT